MRMTPRKMHHNGNTTQAWLDPVFKTDQLRSFNWNSFPSQGKDRYYFFQRFPKNMTLASQLPQGKPSADNGKATAPSQEGNRFRLNNISQLTSSPPLGGGFREGSLEEGPAPPILAGYGVVLFLWTSNLPLGRACNPFCAPPLNQRIESNLPLTKGRSFFIIVSSEFLKFKSLPDPLFSTSP